MTDKVRIAKRDLFAEIDNGEGQKIRQLIAREGQEVPPVLLPYVDEADTTTDRPKTRSTVVGLGTRSGADRRAAVERESREPEHADVRLAAAVVDPEDTPEPAVAPTDAELLAENAELRERVKEAEARAEAAEADAAAAAESPETDATKEKEGDQVKDASEKDGQGGTAEKAQDAAKNKGRTKAGGDKARKGAESK